VRKAFNAGTAQDRDDEDDERRPGPFQNFPSLPILAGAESEISDYSRDGGCGTGGTQSEITDASTTVTFNSNTPLTRSIYPSRVEMHDTSTIASHRSRLSRRTTLTLNQSFMKPIGEFTRDVKDRGRFVWELFKLNYRMLISLTLTLFVAIIVLSVFMTWLMVDLSQLAHLPKLPQ
jgi:hypothetical protein